MKTWSDRKIIDGKAPLDSFNYSLHYAGPAVWEGLRAYVQEDGTCKVFRLREHVQRLRDSAKILGYTLPYTNAEIEQACEALVQHNGNKDLYLRPFAFLDHDAEGIHSIPTKDLKLDIYCVPIPPLHRDTGKGIKMVVSNVIRAYPQFNMQAKTPANYAALMQAQTIMEQTGSQDAFLVDNQGYVVEATVANFFVVKGDVIMTPPNKGSILPGITRRTIAEILGDSANMFKKYKKSVRVVEKDITKADLYTADCVFLCGTYAEVVKVSEIDGRAIDGDDFYFRVIQKEYSDIVRGRK